MSDWKKKAEQLAERVKSDLDDKKQKEKENEELKRKEEEEEKEAQLLKKFRAMGYKCNVCGISSDHQVGWEFVQRGAYMGEYEHEEVYSWEPYDLRKCSICHKYACDQHITYVASPAMWICQKCAEKA